MNKLTSYIAIGALLLLVGFLSYSWWQSSKALKQERQTSVEYYELAKEIEDERDDLQDRYDSINVVLEKYKYLNDSLDALVETKYAQISYLNKELEKALEEIRRAPYEQAVMFINNRYPKVDTFEYSISGSQARNLVVDVVKGDKLEKKLEAQFDIVKFQEAQLAYKDEALQVAIGDRDKYFMKSQELYERLEALTKETYFKDEEILRLKKSLRLWKAGSLTAGAFIAALLIL
jgi:hypothetical protein